MSCRVTRDMAEVYFKKDAFDKAKLPDAAFSETEQEIHEDD